MKVLLDSRTLQVRADAADGARLATLIENIEVDGSTVELSDDRLTPEAVRGFGIVVIPTRANSEGNEYTDEELGSVEAFVHEGGGLLLLSNHGPLPDVPYDHTRYDRELANVFGITIEPAWFALPEGRHSEGELSAEARVETIRAAYAAGSVALTTLEGEALASDHPVIAGPAGGASVHSVVTNNCCGISAEGCIPLVWLAPSMVDWSKTYDPRTCLFAAALDEGRERKGRVVVVGDSGFLGSEDTTAPGPGLIGHGDNLRFVLNALSWLAPRP